LITGSYGVMRYNIRVTHLPMHHILEKIHTSIRTQKAPDTYSYHGWLVSDRFYKRVISFTGYTLLAIFLLECTRIVILYAILFTEHAF
jgi:hypothetical protein